MEIKLHKKIIAIIGISLILFNLILINEAKAYDKINPEDLQNDITTSAPILVVDLRTRLSYFYSHIPTSISIPVHKIARETKKRNIPYTTKIVVYSDTDENSDKGAEILESLGYKDVCSMGGFNRWSYPIEK